MTKDGLKMEMISFNAILSLQHFNTGLMSICLCYHFVCGDMYSPVLYILDFSQDQNSSNVDESGIRHIKVTP